MRRSLNYTHPPLSFNSLAANVTAFVAALSFWVPQADAQISLGADIGNLPRNYNLKWGSAYFDLAAVQSVRWDSNFDRLADPAGGTWIFSTGLLTNVFWQPLPYLKFETDVKIRYEKFSGDAERDGLRLSGGADSATANLFFDFLLNDSIVRLAATAAQDFQDGRITDGGGNQENANIERSNYGVKLSYLTELTPYTRFESSYAFDQSQSRQGEFAALDETTHSIGLAFDNDFAEAVSLGLFLRPKWRDFSEGERTDFVSYAGGTTVAYTTQAGAILRLGLGFDYLVIRSQGDNDLFDEGLHPNADAGIEWVDAKGWEYSAGVAFSNQDSNAIAARGGAVAPQSRQNVLRTFYEVRAPILPELTVTGVLGYEVATDQGGDGDSRSSYDFALATSYQLSPKWDAACQYRYTNQFKADDAGLEFDRHEIRLSLGYKF